jgi:hypothetical protein
MGKAFRLFLLKQTLLQIPYDLVSHKASIVKGSVRGNEITYAGIYPDVNLRYFSFELKLSGVKPVVDNLVTNASFAFQPNRLGYRKL